MSLKAKERKVQLPVASMRAEFSPASFNKEARTIDLVWSVGKKGLRSTWDGSYYEELSMDPANVRMGRLESGSTPFLDNHESWRGTPSVLGVVLKAGIEGGAGIATVRLADPEQIENVDARDTIRKIESGLLKNVSVGYNVYKYERQPQAEGEETPTYLAVDWEPTEISIVPVGFDESAVVRSKDASATDCVFINNLPAERNEEALEMTEEQKREMERAAAEKAKQEAQAAAEAAAEKARTAEKSRQGEIRSIVTKVGLPVEIADRAINEDKTVDQVREIVITEMAKKQEEVRTAHKIEGGKPQQIQGRMVALENALMHRAMPGQVKLNDDGRIFRGMSLMEMARSFLEAGGVRTDGLSKMELATRAFHSTGDFPNVLANVANKSLRKGYEEAPRTFMGWAKEAQLPDFKQVSRTQLGEAPALDKVGETGEITRGTISDGAEKYSLATYAKIIAISRQVLINDDLNAFTGLPQKFGFAAASLESDVVYAILTANAALSDTIALFHASHSNLGTAGAPSVTTLAEARKLMRLQKGLAGRPLNIQAKSLIVPAALELVSEQILSQLIVATQTSNTNPFINKLTPVVEPRLDAASATAWYVACDPNQCDTVEYGYLEGQQGVYSETRMGFDVDGMEVKARLDFAAKALDFRGMVKNSG